jgi:hypothetical protein
MSKAARGRGRERERDVCGREREGGLRQRQREGERVREPSDVRRRIFYLTEPTWPGWPFEKTHQ